MAASSYTIEVDATQVIAMLNLAAEEVKPNILAHLAEASELVVTAMKEKAPVGVGGDSGLRGSIGYQLAPEALSSEIKPQAPYSDAVETGSVPHWAPVAPLQAWADMRGINVYALRWSIAQKGTAPHPFIKPTYDEVIPVVVERFAAGMAELAGMVAV